jgi:hypothetical protein
MSYPIIDLALEKTEANKMQWLVTARETQYLAVVPEPNGQGPLMFYLTKAGEGLFLLTVKDENGAECARAFSEDLAEEDRERLAFLFRIAEGQARGPGSKVDMVEEALRKL